MVKHPALSVERDLLNKTQKAGLTWQCTGEARVEAKPCFKQRKEKGRRLGKKKIETKGEGRMRVGGGR